MPDDGAGTRLGNSGADQPADKRVRTARRDSRPQVIRFQMIAPINAPNTTPGSTTAGAIMPVPMVWATCRPKKRKAMKLKKAAQSTAALRRQNSRRDNGGDRVGRVMKAIEKIKDKCDGDEAE